MMHKICLLTLLICFSGANAYANERYHLQEPFCDFEITFPETPRIRKAEDLEIFAEFTKIYDLAHSVRTDVTCKALKPEDRMVLAQDILLQELEKFALETNVRITSSNRSTNDTGEIQTTVVVGHKEGQADSSFVTYQYWLGPSSLFLMEAVKTGANNEEQDNLFFDILRSMQPVDAVSQP